MSGFVKSSLVEGQPNGYVYILKNGKLRIRRAHIDQENIFEDRAGKYRQAWTHQGCFRVPANSNDCRMDFGCGYMWSYERTHDSDIADILTKAVRSSIESRIERCERKLKGLREQLDLLDKLDIDEEPRLEKTV